MTNGTIVMVNEKGIRESFGGQFLNTKIMAEDAEKSNGPLSCKVIFGSTKLNLIA